MDKEILKYYSRKDIQKAILNEAENKEVAVSYSDKGFGKRPDILQFENDIYELAKLGATSFHISEEHWKNPLLLKPGMTKKELDELRSGWDCILDLDSNYFEYARIAALLIIEALKFHDIKNISIKFSGNKGIHLGISFKSFPYKVNNILTKDLFPEGVRVIALYLKEMIKEQLSIKLLEKDSIEDLAKNTLQEKSNLTKNSIFDPFIIVDIDTILISNRHVYRAPYSLHEKSGLVSLPLKFHDLLNFKFEQAKPENVKTNIKFLNDSDVIENEAKSLILQAFDWYTKQKPLQEEKKSDYKDITIFVKKDFFPPCINKLLNGIKTDGRKRALFILINFFKSAGYSIDDIKSIISEWNKKNYQPLKEGYIIAQLSWHKKINQKILPPNCDNPAYYKNLLLCEPDNLCKLIKNPVNYAIRKQRIYTKNLKSK